jgi:hypothetical protein
MTPTSFQSKNSASIFNSTSNKSESNAINIPSINLPKGGGAIKGIDEKFTVNAINGTCSFSIPIPFSNARNFTPSLNLSYNSGSGNSPFGIGWNLDLPTIRRKIDKKLPRYRDSEDSDTFLFADAEDLVPEFKKDPSGKFLQQPNGSFVINEFDSPDATHTIRIYKPRIEKLYSRIERWTNKYNYETKWRVTTKDNITTLFGWTPSAQIASPQMPSQIFEWFPEFVFDDRGNCYQYVYKKENSDGINALHSHNKNRIYNGEISYTNIYLEKVLYGVKQPYNGFGALYPDEHDYFFQTVFDYGEYESFTPYNKSNPWEFRPDPFSDYRSGFEIRTTRLCKRVLLFHYFDELPEGSALVKSLNFTYKYTPDESFSFLQNITTYGYIKNSDNTYSSKNIPPLEFEYQPHTWNTTIQTISNRF